MRRSSLADALAIVSFTTAAAADEKEACIAASEGADRLEDARKLIELRERLAFCARDACPKLVRDECVRRLEGLDKRIPTFIIRATDSQGEDIVDARVFVDDKLIAEGIDGEPIKLDPGPHSVRIEPKNHFAKAQRIVAAEGDHLRQVTLHFQNDQRAPVPGQADDETDPTAPPPRAAETPMTPGHPVQRWIGVGMIVGGSVLTIAGIALVPSALSNYSSYRAEGVFGDCPTNDPTGVLAGGQCHKRDTSGLTFNERGNSLLIPAVVLIPLGSVLAITGIVLLATSFPHAITRAKVTPAFGPGYAGLSFAATF